jgi:hypothetical protein
MDRLPVLDRLPCDGSNPHYTQSFDPVGELPQACAFLNEYGFVVFRDIFTAVECASTRAAMWSILEDGNPGFDRSNKTTWNNLKAKGSYGLSLRGPTFHPTLVANRCVHGTQLG